MTSISSAQVQNNIQRSTASTRGQTPPNMSAFDASWQPSAVIQMLFVQLVMQLMQQMLGGNSSQQNHTATASNPSNNDVNSSAQQNTTQDASTPTSNGAAQVEAPVATSAVEHLPQQTPTTEQTTPSTPVAAIESVASTATPATNSTVVPSDSNLSIHDQHLLIGMLTNSGDGTMAKGSATIKGTDFNHHPQAGDVVTFRDETGKEVGSHTLSTKDIYEFNFREQLISTVQDIGEGWRFAEDPKVVEIPGAQLNPPEESPYQKDDGSLGVEKVTERNNFWEAVERDNGARFLRARTHDAAGNPIKPSDAINDLFNNRDAYKFDCATPLPVINQKTTLDLIGSEKFDAQAGQIIFSGWHDYKDGDNDGGLYNSVNTASAGHITINGNTNVEGELLEFSPALGDQLIPGNGYYFELPGDTSSNVQGWNAYYLGEREPGSHQFWSSSYGMVDVRFENNSWETEQGFGGYYLGSAMSEPDIANLMKQDNNGFGFV